MSLRAKTLRLAHKNPTLRPQLLKILAARMPRPGDVLRLRSIFPGTPWKEKDKELVVKDTRERFTQYGGSPFALQVLVEDPENPKIKPQWVWSWYFWGFPEAPKKFREPVDDALKAVLNAVKPYKKVMKRVTPRGRGDRQLQPKTFSTVIPYDDVVRLLSSNFTKKGAWDSMAKFTTEVQVGESEYKTFYVTVHKDYSGDKIRSIDISPMG